MLNETDLHVLRGLAAGKTQAAIGAELNLDQSAVSKLLRIAEERCGIGLVARHGRRLTLTADGFQIARASENVLNEFEALDRLVVSLRDGSAGAIRIFAAAKAADYVLPPLIAGFLAKVPGTHVQLQVAAGDAAPLSEQHLLELFTNGRFDAAVLSDPAPFSEPLVTRPLYRDHAVLFAGPGHPLFGASRREFAEIADEPLVANYTDPVYARILHSEQFAVHCGRRIDLHTGEAVRRFVAEGVGLGLLFRTAIRDDLSAGRLHVVAAPAAAECTRRFVLVHHAAASSSALAANVRRFLEEALSEPAPA